MANASVQSTSRLDTANEVSERWRKQTNSRSLGQAPSVESILFDSLFTTEFFQSALPISPKSSSQSDVPVGFQDATAVVPDDELSNSESSEPTNRIDDSDEESETKEESSQASLGYVGLVPQNNVVQVEDDGAKDTSEIQAELVACCETKKTVETSDSQVDSLDNSADSLEGLNTEVDPETVDSAEQTLSFTDSDAPVYRPVEKVVSGDESSLGKQRKSRDGVQKKAAESNAKDGDSTESSSLLASNQQSFAKRDSEDSEKPTTLQPTTDAGTSSSDLSSQEFSLDERGTASQESSTPLNRRAERLQEKRSEREPTNERLEQSVAPSPELSQENTQPNPSALTTNGLEQNISASMKAELNSGSSLPSTLPLASSAITPPATVSPTGVDVEKKVNAADSVARVQVAPTSPAVGSGKAVTNANVTVDVATAVTSNSSSNSNGDANAEATTSYRSLERTNEEPSLTAYQQSRLLQRVLKGLERFADGSSTVRLRLHPPELGALEMSLHMKQQRLTATVMVDSESARMVLQENLPQLQSKLSEQGITVERIEFQARTSDSQQSGDSFSQNADSRGGQAGSNGDSGQGRQFGEARLNQLRGNWIDGLESPIEPQRDLGVRLTSTTNINVQA